MQVLSSFKCYFKRKYLNLIDSNCDVDESCPWFFIGMYYQYLLFIVTIFITQDNSSYSTQAFTPELNVLLTSVFLNDY